MLDGVAHRNPAADGVAIGAGRRVTDRLPIAINQFAAPQDGFRILQYKDGQPAFDARGLLLEQRLAPEKGFVPVDGEGESSFERCIVRR